MTDAQVLVVSDHQESALLWIHGLNHHSIRAKVVTLEADYNRVCIHDTCELVILDINSDRGGIFSICRYARADFAGPILLFTYEDDERFHVEAYQAGIDESISKPVGIALAIAKVASWLRRASISPAHRHDNLHGVGRTNFRFDQTCRVLTTPDGRVARLSKLEFRLVAFLIDHVGQILEADRIIDQVWMGDEEMNCSVLKNLVYRLRRKIEPDPGQPRYIRTVPGHGYCFATELI